MRRSSSYHHVEEEHMGEQLKMSHNSDAWEWSLQGEFDSIEIPQLYD